MKKLYDPSETFMDMYAEGDDLFEIDIQKSVLIGYVVLYIHVNGITRVRVGNIKEDHIEVRNDLKREAL